MKTEWELIAIGDICKTGAGGTPLKSKKEYYEGGRIPWLQSGEVAQGEITESQNFITELGLQNSSAKIFSPGTILVAMYGATAGQVGRLRISAATNQAVCGIFPNERVISEYLYYALLSKKSDLIATATGNAQPNISQIKVKNTVIPIPSLLEQKQIVAILDEAFEGIAAAAANAEKNLANARELFETYLNSIFTKKGYGWVEKKFEELIESNIIGLTKSSREQGENKAFPYVKMNNITRDNRFDFAKFTSVDATRDEVHNFALKNRDFLFNTRNSFELVGKSCLYEGDPDEVVLFNNNIMRIRFKKGVDARFILLAFSSEPVKNKLNTLKSGTTNVSAIYFRDLRSLAIPVPPTDTQRMHATKLDNLQKETQRLEVIYKQKLSALTELKQSLLQKAFAGELTAETAKTNKKQAPA